jgi:hypothetical protein
MIPVTGDELVPGMMFQGRDLCSLIVSMTRDEKGMIRCTLLTIIDDGEVLIDLTNTWYGCTYSFPGVCRP